MNAEEPEQFLCTHDRVIQPGILFLKVVFVIDLQIRFDGDESGQPLVTDLQPPEQNNIDLASPRGCDQLLPHLPLPSAGTEFLAP